MLLVIGADWCGGCKAIRRKLLQKNIEHQYIEIPYGKAGWDFVEKLTGRRAVPAVVYHFPTLKEFHESIDSIPTIERELTEEEMDDLE